MAYRFKLHEPVGKGVRRIGLEQIERAETELNGAGDKATAVHETRKGLKRIRALLRLVRPGLGEETYQRENARFRDIGALLSGTRDRHVMLETVMKISARAPSSARAALGSARDLILSEQNGTDPSEQDHKIRTAMTALRQGRGAFNRLSIDPPTFTTLGNGLYLSYRRNRRAFRDAYNAPSDEAFHEWRKTVQAHWRHMSLLSRAWPDYCEARLAEARTLSQILGDDHDLAVLAAFVRGDREAPLSNSHADLIEGLCRERQQQLRTQARPRGERLLAEGAHGFRRRMTAYWEASRLIASQEEEVEAAVPTPAAPPPSAPPAKRRRA